MNQNEVISSARLLLFLVPAGGTSDPLPLAYVEDVNASNTYRSENYPVVGSGISPDNNTNFMEGRIRWGKVFQIADALRRVIAPRVAEFTAYEAYDLLGVDARDNKPIFYAYGCRPESMDINARGGMSPRSNYSGICRAVLIGDEIDQALAA